MSAAARVPAVRSGKGSALAVAAVAVLVLGVSTAPASAGGVRCGDVITEDTKLEEDLVDCPGNGLEIGADGVTLDLGGHVVDGTGTGQGIRSHGNSHVQIKRGTIRQFGVGISLGRAPSFPGGSERGPASQNHLLRNLTVRDNVGPGIALARFGIDRHTIERNELVANGGAGISLNEAAHNRVVRNRIVGNGAGVLISAGMGVGSDDNVVLQNRVIANERFGIAVGLTPFADDRNRIARNDVLANGTDGIVVATRGTGNVVERNRSDLNGDDGIDVECPDAFCAPGQATLTTNAANRNGDLGIEADPGVDDRGRNTARRNGNPAQCVGVTCS